MGQTAVWVSSDGSLSIREVPSILPSSLAPKQYLIRVQYSGINPADKKHAIHLGLGDRVTGYDAVGTIVACGPQAMFRTGTRVCLLARAGIFQNQSIYGAHQEVLVAEERGCFSLRSDAPLEVAATLPVVAAAAADCLFSLLPSKPSLCSSNRVPLLICGGSSAVGHAAIQFAQVAGVWPILVAASHRHHATLEKRGATVCFEYRDENVLETIKSAVGELAPGQILDRAIDATGSNADNIEASCSDNAALMCTAGGPHGLPKPFSAVIYNEDVKLGNGVVVKRRTEDAFVVKERVQWALDNLGTKFHQVPVQVVDGDPDTFIDRLNDVAEGKVSFTKYVMKWCQ